MEKREILEAYLKHNNLKIVRGNSWDPILPFLMMDCVYQMYSETIKPLPLRHEQKRNRSIWRDNYQRMNQSFFRSFNDDQQDEVINIMDQFNEYIKNDLDRLRFAFMGCLPIEDIETKKIISVCMATSALTNAAEHIFKNRFSKVKLAYGDPVIYLEKIKISAVRIANYYYKASTDFNPNTDRNLSGHLQALCNRMVRFLNI